METGADQSPGIYIRVSWSPAWLHCLYGLNLHRPLQELRHAPHMQTPTWRQLNMGIPSLTGYCLWSCREGNTWNKWGQTVLHLSWPALRNSSAVATARRGSGSQNLAQDQYTGGEREMSNIGNITYTWNVSSLQEDSDKPNGFALI